MKKLLLIAMLLLAACTHESCFRCDLYGGKWQYERDFGNCETIDELIYYSDNTYKKTTYYPDCNDWAPSLRGTPYIVSKGRYIVAPYESSIKHIVTSQIVITASSVDSTYIKPGGSEELTINYDEMDCNEMTVDFYNGSFNTSREKFNFVRKWL